MFILRFLWLLSFLCLILSCEQNPLKGLPDTIQNGVLKTGSHNLSFFKNFLYPNEKMVKVSIPAKNDLVLAFTEGQMDAYRIQVRLLYGLEEKYDLLLRDETFFELKESKWDFDFEKNEGVLQWRPDKTYTGTHPYKSFSIPLFLEFREKNSVSKDPSSTLKKDINVIVYKSLDEPEIYKVITPYNEYEKLDDKNFYAKYGAKSLNLNYYDKIFAGNRMQQKISHYLELYSSTTFHRFNHAASVSSSPLSEEREFDSFAILDKFRKNVPDDILGFIKQPLYHLVKIRENAGDCSQDMAVPLNQESWCAEELDVKRPVDFNKDIYIKRYKIPDEIHPDHLFFKVESLDLCKAYYKISSANIGRKKTEWKPGSASCYLSVAQVYNIQDGVKEREGIYLQKESGEFELINKSEWKPYFYEIPKSVQRKMGGYKPVPGNVITLHLIKQSRFGDVYHYSDIEVYIRDYNYLDKAPVLESSPDMKGSIFNRGFPENLGWGTPVKTEKLEEHIWMLNYHISWNDSNSEQEEDELFKQLEISLYPVSGLVNGQNTPFNLFVHPVVKMQHLEHFDWEKDVDFSANAKMNQNGSKSWLSSSLSIASKIKKRFVFSKDFIRDFHDIILFEQIPFYNRINSEKEKISDYIEIKRTSPRATYNCTRQGFGFFARSRCECSEWLEYEKEEQVYLESLCSYQVNFDLSLQTKNIIDADGNIRSFYQRYDYFIPEEEKLLPKQLKGMSIVLEAEPFVSGYKPPFQIREFGNRVHIFFNLQPHLQCTSEHDSEDKKCKISYPLDSYYGTPRFESNEVIFSKHGIHAHLFCSDNKNTHFVQGAGSCPCNKNPVISGKGIEFDCTFERDYKGIVSIHLETKNPYIYFLNTEGKGDESLLDHKKTPVKILEVF